MNARVVFGVGIGDSALFDQAGDPALHRAIHEELLEDLAVHGQLVFRSQQDLHCFIAALQSLPTSLGKAWEAVLSSRRVSVEIADPAQRPVLAEVADAEQLEEQMAPEVELVLVQADQAQQLGVPREDFSAHTPGGLVEIGRIATAGRTVTVQAAKAGLVAPLREGGTREQEWEQRLGPLCEAAQPVVVYDKYLGMQMVRAYVDGRHRGEGLTWFLTKLSTLPQRRVRVITAVSRHSRDLRKTSEEQVVEAFHMLLAGLERPLDLELVLAPDRLRSTDRIERFGHDRHLRFGDRVVLAIGIGLQAFADPEFRETITVARLPVADAKAREEEAIRGQVRPPASGWLGQP